MEKGHWAYNQVFQIYFAKRFIDMIGFTEVYPPVTNQHSTERKTLNWIKSFLVFFLLLLLASSSPLLEQFK